MSNPWKIVSISAGLILVAGLSAAPVLAQEEGTELAEPWSPEFGSFVEFLLNRNSMYLFGVGSPVLQSSTRSISQVAADADPRRLVTVAAGLNVGVLSSAANLGPNIDMMVLWPNDTTPTHLIACNEQGAAEPSVQRIRFIGGAVETLLTGMISCDPIRRTPWGTLIVGEEVGGTGHLLEIINPLAVTNTLFDRTTHQISNGPFGTGAENVVDRPAVGRLAFEGIALYPNGVMYYGDENRPFQGTPGGAYFKFIPSEPWMGGDPITNLDESPLTNGAVFGLRLGKRPSGGPNADYGQGSNTGLGTWIPVDNPSGADLRAVAATLELTGYYRPEDAEVDRRALRKGNVRFCAANTGNEGQDHNWGEFICITDGTLEQSLANTATPEAQYLVIGTPELAMNDNVEYQESRGNWILHEDGDGPDTGFNNDLWSCLDDSNDDDQLSDGCVRIATLNDLNAEWTGGFFDQSGTIFIVSLQHNVTGHGVVLIIWGWQ